MSKKIISGTITSGYTLNSAYTALSITSTGIIDGAPGGVALTSQYGAPISNAGTIVGGAGEYGPQSGGAGGAGISLAGGGTLNNKRSIAGGAGANGYGRYGYGGAGGTGASLTDGGTLDNRGSIAGGAGGSSENLGGAGGGGVSLTDSGNVDNSGSIIGGGGGGGSAEGGSGGSGVSLANGGSVFNTGLISGGAGGSGYYGCHGGVGVSLLSGGIVDNKGAITGGGGGGGRYEGAVGGGVALLAGGTVDNSGLIDGGGGLAAGVGADTGMVVNQGTIIGGEGVVIGHGGTIENSGTIIGNGSGDRQFYGAGIYASGGTTNVTNSGTIIGAGKRGEFGSWYLAAVDLFGAGTFTNEAGARARGYSGFWGSEDTSVVNYGVIDGMQAVGVGGAESIINHLGGLMKGELGVEQQFGTLINFGTIEGAYFGVSLNAGTVINFGTIEGAYFGVSLNAGTVINFGTIESSHCAVRLGSYGRLIAETGSTFIGPVQGGEGALELASGTETITGLGATGTISGGVAMTFSGFGTYQLDAGGRFTLWGTNTLASGDTLTDGGTLTDRGTVTQNGTVTIGTAAAAASLSILKTGVWDIGSGDIAGGGASGDKLRIYGDLIKNAGTGVSGIGVVTFDDGTIAANAGTLDFAGRLFGTGMLQIGIGATLEADAAAIKTLTVGFDGTDATLAMRSAKTFAATISGFAVSDTFDLLETTATGASVNGSDQLVIVDGATTVATLQLSGSYAGTTFGAGSDGNGGTDITIVDGESLSPMMPRTSSPHLLVAAMAAMGAGAAGAVSVHDPGPVREAILSRPGIQAV